MCLAGPLGTDNLGRYVIGLQGGGGYTWLGELPEWLIRFNHTVIWQALFPRDCVIECGWGIKSMKRGPSLAIIITNHNGWSYQWNSLHYTHWSTIINSDSLSWQAFLFRIGFPPPPPNKGCQDSLKPMNFPFNFIAKTEASMRLQVIESCSEYWTIGWGQQLRHSHPALSHGRHFSSLAE